MKRANQKYVYFAKPIGLDGPIKIGCSDHPPSRILSLGAWSPLPLEMIGTVPGTTADEHFVHCCFAHLHSHREWFRSSQELRDAIKKVLEGGSVAVLKGVCAPTGDIRTAAQRKRNRTESHRRYLSYTYRIIWAQKKLRLKGDETAWHAPPDVGLIMNEWGDREHYRANRPYTLPSPEKIARLDQYLADPVSHSIIPAWGRPRLVADNTQVAS